MAPRQTSKPPSGGKMGDVIAMALGVGLTTIVLKADHARMSPWDYFEVAFGSAMAIAVIGGISWSILKVWDRLRG